VLGIRTATSDDDGRVRADVQPAGFATAAGVSYAEFSNLLEPLPVTEWAGHAERLVEGLVADGAEVLAGYDHPHFGRWAAVTTRAVGAGRITYLGAFPDLELATALGEYLGAANPWGAALEPGRITAQGAVNAAGERIWFVHNWGDAPRTIRAPFAVEDVLAPGETATEVVLHGRDVRVLREVAG
jgi:beta-galactosidase